MSTAKPSTTRSSDAKAYRIQAPKGLDLEPRQFIEMYRYMVLNRKLENRLSVLFRQGLIVGGLFRSLGQEATSIGTAYALEEGDMLGPMIRNLGAYLVRGVTVREWFAQYMGRVTGPTRAKDGNAHFGDISRGLIAPISMLGALIPVLAGVALTFKHRGQKNVAITYIGDGGTSTTDFHEGINFAAVQKVPFILVCEHNQYAYSTPTAKQFPVKDIVAKAPSYGIYGEKFDGNNVLAAYDATRRARLMCLDGEGPVLLEAKTFRRVGHAEHDPATYVPKKLMAQWEAKDPIDAYTRFLIDEDVAKAADLEAIGESIDNEIDATVADVANDPLPDKSIALEDVYAR